MHPALQGLIAAVLTAAIVAAIPSASVHVLAGLLWLTVGMYLGMGLMDGHNLRVEAMGGTVTLALAVLGVVVSPWFLVAGWLTHPIWDMLHHRGVINTTLHPIVVPFCLVYDVLVAGVAAWAALAA